MLLAVALVSFASLLTELGLTRLFSVVLFYHFAFLAISVALLGLGAGGVFSYVRRDWLAKYSSRTLGARLCAANAVLILLALEVVLHLPISLELSWVNFGKLSVDYLFCAAPFFVTGLLFSVVFAREAKNIARIYSADLIGGALACMAVVPLLNFIGGPNAILFASVAMGAAAVIWSETKRQKQVGIAVAAAFTILVAANYSGRLVDIVYAKGMRRDRSVGWVEFAKWNAISRVEVDQVGQSKYIVIDADASTAIMNVDPAKWEQTVNTANNLNLVDRSKEDTGYNWKKDLMSAAPAVANVLRPNGKYAIIGPGGGVDVLRAVANGSKDVTAIEINPIIATTIMRDKYADYAFHLYDRPEVHLHVGDGRSFIRNSKEQYDVIQMTLVDTWASTAAGAFALSENNLYTVEAFEEYFQHLKPDGMIAITRWEFKEPREALRVVSQAMEALERSGNTAQVSQQTLVVSDGPLNEDGRPVLTIIKKSEFTNNEKAVVTATLESNKNLKSIAFPCSYGPPIDECSKRKVSELQLGASAAFVKLIETGVLTTCGGSLCDPGQDRDRYFRSYPYNITPVYDSNPFFFFTIKTGDVFEKILSGTGRGMDWRINLGVTVLFMVFGISIVAVLAFLVLPLLFYSRNEKPETRNRNISRLLYFVAVGLGFILVEIALIQRFVLFLGHPTYALTVVVFLMLLSSGAGSFLSRRLIKETKSIWLPLLVIAAGVSAYLLVLPAVLGKMIGADFYLKLLISGALIIPLGLLMGMPFPTGLRALEELGDTRIEWAWAMNAAASVLGSVSAMIIAIHFGLNVTLACGAAAYLLAIAFKPAAGGLKPTAESR